MIGPFLWPFSHFFLNYIIIFNFGHKSIVTGVYTIQFLSSVSVPRDWLLASSVRVTRAMGSHQAQIPPRGLTRPIDS
jgi:hypothetical protein